MSGPNSGWNPDGTPKDGSDAGTDADGGTDAPQQPSYGTPQQPSYGDAPQRPTYGVPLPQASYGDAPQQPSYPTTGQDFSGGQPGYAAPPPPPPPPYPTPDQSQYGGPMQPGYPPAPPPKKSRPWVGIVLLLIVVVGVGGYFLFRDRLSGSAGDLSVGDCIDQPTGDSAITDVQHQPCNEPHDGEVFAVINHTAAAGATYPLTSEFQDLVQDECIPALEAYTARRASEVYAAGLDISFLYPSASSWSEGDREVSCFIVKSDESKMTGTVRAGGSTPAP